MQRDTRKLTATKFDVLVVGGGIYGASTAYEAAQRGLSVALIEKSDFGGATSANSLKIIHGGLRYLQQIDFARMRESIRERRTLLRIAPHLVHSLPVAIPTYGHGMRSSELMAIALLLNDFVSADRNRHIDPGKHIPAGHIITRADTQRLFPGIRLEGLTGAAVFNDAQVYHSERLTLAFVQSAVQKGACVANYVEATYLLQTDGRVKGVHARDTLTGDQFDIFARVTINMAGPWADQLNATYSGHATKPRTLKAKAINIITRPLFKQYAVGVSSPVSYHDRDAVINKGNRLFFIAPWRGYSLVGTAYYPCNDTPDSLTTTESELTKFLSEVNQACPGAHLRPSDVLFIHQGLLPMTSVHPISGDVQLMKHYTLQGEWNGGIAGLITVSGVKYTTARDVAQKTVSQIFALWGMKPPPSATARMPLYGGNITRYNDYLRQQIKNSAGRFTDQAIQSLVMNYGTQYTGVIAGYDRLAHSNEPEPLMLLRAKIRYAVKHEMAYKLSDIIFRRTELGSAGYPGADLVRFSADCMADEFGWDQARTEHELQEVQQIFARFTPTLTSNAAVSLAREISSDGTKLAYPAIQ